jgi:hypothetical protein
MSVANTRSFISTALMVVLLSAPGAQVHAQESNPQGAPTNSGSWDDSEPGASPAIHGWHGRFQLRRENVDRGTSGETTRTYVRADSYLWGGLLSVQVAFPDAKTDFAGSPFDPRLGDSKLRFRFAPVPLHGFDVSWFIETTFPTADPEELGSGKYQLSAGVSATTALPVPKSMSATHMLRTTVQLQQANSVAGDEQQPDINYTKLDLSLRDTWGNNWLRLSLNTRVDWEQDGRTGAVGELEYGRRLDLHWSLWVMGGGLLWGEGVKGTYGAKLMFGVDRWF